jgi:hypothetical protein
MIKTNKNIIKYEDFILLLFFTITYEYSFFSNSYWMDIIINNFSNYQNFYTYCLPKLSDACSYVKGAFFLLDPKEYGEHYWTNNLWPPGLFHLHFFLIKTKVDNPYIYLNIFLCFLWIFTIYITLKKIKWFLIKLMFIIFICSLFFINKNLTNILFSEAYYCLFTISSFIFLNSNKKINITIGAFLLYLMILFHLRNLYLFYIIIFFFSLSLFYYKFLNKSKLAEFFFYKLLKKILLIFIIVSSFLLITFLDYKKREGTAYAFKMVWGKEDVLSNGINMSACKININMCEKIQNQQITDDKTIMKITLITFLKNPFKWTYYKIPIMFENWSINNFLFSIVEIIMFLIIIFELLRKKDLFNFSLFFSSFLILITSVIIHIEGRYFFQLKIVIIFYFFYSFKSVTINKLKKYIPK